MYILIAVICSIISLVGIVAYGLWEKWSIRRKVANLGTLVICNSNNGIIAACRKSDFDIAIAKYWAEVHSGEKKPTERISVRVAPTFTFFEKSAHQRPVHTGHAESLRQIEIDLIRKATGFKVQYCDRWMAHPLISDDSRLFVPFAADSVLDGQLEFYGMTSVEEARTHLLQVP